MIEIRKEWDFVNAIGDNINQVAVLHKSNTYNDDFRIYSYRAYPKTLFNSMIGRECRGIVFGNFGDIVCRPFHKFFNIGERVETELSRINPTHYAAKMDGSLISVFVFDNQLYFKTKNTFSSPQAKKAPNLLPFDAHNFIYNNPAYTYMFEYTSPDNQIVVEYEKERLTLLAVRHNISGEYDWGVFDKVPCNKSVWLSISNLEKVVENARGAIHAEGVVLRNKNEFWKAKSSWYVLRHSAISMNVAKIVELTLDNKYDDVVPLIEKRYLEKFNTIVDDVWVWHLKFSDIISETMAVDGHLDRKTFAIKHRDNELFHYLMRAFCGKDLDSYKWVLEKVKLKYKNEQLFVLQGNENETVGGAVLKNG